MRIHGVSSGRGAQEHLLPVQAGHVEQHEGEAEPKGHPHGQGQQELLGEYVACSVHRAQVDDQW